MARRSSKPSSLTAPFLTDGKVVREVSLSETPHYRIMRDFMNTPAIMMERLFNDIAKDDEDM